MTPPSGRKFACQKSFLSLLLYGYFLLLRRMGMALELAAALSATERGAAAFAGVGELSDRGGFGLAV
jgi:hypothetical protein